MAATIALTGKEKLGTSWYLAHGTFTNASGGSTVNTLAQTDHGLNYIIGAGFLSSTEARVFRYSASGGTVSFYCDDPSDTDDGTWFLIGR